MCVPGARNTPLPVLWGSESPHGGCSSQLRGQRTYSSPGNPPSHLASGLGWSNVRTLTITNMSLPLRQVALIMSCWLSICHNLCIPTWFCVAYVVGQVAWDAFPSSQEAGACLGDTWARPWSAGARACLCAALAWSCPLRRGSGLPPRACLSASARMRVALAWSCPLRRGSGLPLRACPSASARVRAALAWSYPLRRGSGLPLRACLSGVCAALARLSLQRACVVACTVQCLQSRLPAPL